MNGHARYQTGCLDCEAENFRFEPAGPTRDVSSGLVSAQNYSRSCDICSGVSGGPIHLIRADSAHGVGHGTRNAEQARNAKTRGASKWMILMVVIGAVLVAGYFYWRVNQPNLCA